METIFYVILGAIVAIPTCIFILFNVVVAAFCIALREFILDFSENWSRHVLEFKLKRLAKKFSYEDCVPCTVKTE